MRYLFLLTIGLIPTLANALGFGDVAGNLIQPVEVASNFIGSTSIAVGMCSLFGSVLRYAQYRENPLAVPISTVIMLFIIGVVLVCLPLVCMLTTSGIPYKFYL